MPKTEEQCKQMRDDMRNKILKMSSLYFARNGFGDTKISDLAKHIGIGQVTIYLYFKSKEELFNEIRSAADNKEELKKAAPVKKEEPKKEIKKTATAVEVKEKIFVEYQDVSYDESVIMKKAESIWTKTLGNKADALKSIELYIKPEDKKAYYVFNKKESGSFDI